MMNSILRFGSRSHTWNRGKTLLLVLSILSLTGCESVRGQGETGNLATLTRTLSVSGRGEVNIPKTISQVRMGVEVQGKTSTEVQQEVAKRSSAVVKLLQSRKEVEKLETTGINLNPNYSYNNGKQRITGYTGRNIVSFQIEPEKTGNLLDEAVKVGATRIDGVTLVASDSAIAQAQKQAIQKASDEANKQADAALSALNLTQREIIGIQINGAAPPVPRLPMEVAASPMGLDSTQNATPIVAGEQKVQAFVTLQIRY